MQVEKSQAEWAMELNDVRLALARSEERAAKLEYENGWLLKGMASLPRPRLPFSRSFSSASTDVSRSSA